MSFETIPASSEQQAAYTATQTDSDHTDNQIQNHPAVCISIGDFLRKELPAREVMLSPWLTMQSLFMIYAWRGIGKSWLALTLAYAVACGGVFLGWKAPQKRRVLYIDGELPAPTLQERLSLIVNSFDDEPFENGFSILTPDLQPNGVMPNLSSHLGRDLINEHINGVDLIIIDNLSTLARSGKENEGESWLPIQEWALKHRAQGRSIGLCIMPEKVVRNVAHQGKKMFSILLSICADRLSMKRMRARGLSFILRKQGI